MKKLETMVRRQKQLADRISKLEYLYSNVNAPSTYLYIDTLKHRLRCLEAKIDEAKANA